jgi:hypothetical protein
MDPLTGAPPAQTNDPGILQYLLPIIAGVASAATPGLARGVGAGLGTYGALQHDYRLKQALREAEQKKAVASQNFGKVVDYYTGGNPPEGPSASAPSPQISLPPTPDGRPTISQVDVVAPLAGIKDRIGDLGVGRPTIAQTDALAGNNERIRSFLDEHGLPKDAQLPPQMGAFYKSLFEIDPAHAIAGLQGYVTREHQPTKEETLAAGQDLKAGQKITAKTREGFGIEMTAPEAQHVRTEIRDAQGNPNPAPGKGFKWDVGVGPSGNEVYARNTGEPYSASESPEHFRSLLALRSVGQTTGDARINQMTPAAAAALYREPKTTSGDKETGRLDRSYNLTQTQLNKLSDPLDARLQRFSTLQDTVNQRSPQADSLIAPELLTTMAGGQGSGLRMNEAEIARIVGGRSNWESLKAAVNKWRGAGDALSVTPAQRGQIQSLLNVVHGKLIQKKQVLDDTSQRLIKATDVDEHRQIYNDARKALSSVDTGTAPASAGPTALSPAAQKYLSGSQ